MTPAAIALNPSPGTAQAVRGAGAAARREDPKKILEAARQFEALLITQILRSARQSGEGWLGSGGDSSSDCASGYAEEQFATAMAQGGGLGLANIIAAGLAKAQAETSDDTRSGDVSKMTTNRHE
jgi:peptidoglycan hydrolase FlgJ